jgi:hypothetical protein
MNREDATAVPWMAEFRRNPAPKKVVWYQDDVTHDRFYWLSVPAGKARKGATVIATVDGQEIKIERSSKIETLLIRLDDRLLDLDRPIKVTKDGKLLFSGLLPRTIATLRDTLSGPGDRKLMFCSQVAIELANE